MTTTTRGIDHIGITVPDLDAATRFFERAFDAHVVYDAHLKSDPPQTGADAEEMLGLSPGTQVIAIRHLRLADGPGIELFEARKADAAPPAGLGDIGMHHFGLYCDDVERARDRAMLAGALSLAGPNALPGPEAGDGNRMMYIRTPWGMLIELIAYPSGVARSPIAARWTPQSEE